LDKRRSTNDVQRQAPGGREVRGDVLWGSPGIRVDRAVARDRAPAPIRPSEITMTPHVTVIGDDDGVLVDALRSSDAFRVSEFRSIESALSAFHRERPVLAIIALPDHGRVGQFAALTAIKLFDRDMPVVVVGRQDDVAIAEATRLGAAAFIVRPFARRDLAGRVASLLQHRAAHGDAVTVERELSRDSAHHLLLGDSAAIENVRRIIESVKDLDCTVLVRGESGTGKELVSRAIASSSVRRGRPFVKVNCAALPAELLESELFGYERGAFTGAMQRKLGKFEFAHQGTIFLDEIGEMSAPMQAKVLQVLQDGEFSRLGGTHDTRVDVRIIAATHRDLEREIAEGRFREDLYFRLNVISIALPPLRERLDEIPVLSDHFLRRYSDLYAKPYQPLAPHVLDLFLRYSWPGNIRQLENIIQHLVILGNDSAVRELQAIPGPVASRSSAVAVAHDTGVMSQPAAPAAAKPGRAATPSLKDAARCAAQKVERELIVETLRQMRWNRKEAAKMLGVSYKTLLAKIRDNGLDGEIPGGQGFENAS
jgi:two-component system response regulator AtoC